MASVDLVTTDYGTSTAALRIGAGSSVASSAPGAVVLGPGATSYGRETVVIGAGACAGEQGGSSAAGSVVIGAAVKAEHDDSVVIGSSAFSTGVSSSGVPAAVVVGRSATAAPRGVAVGSSAVSEVAGTAVGSGATVKITGVALGSSAMASSGSVAVGTAAKASGIYSSGSSPLADPINPEGRHLVVGENARGIVAEFPIASDDEEGSDAQVVVTGFSQAGETSANHFHISSTDLITIKGMRFTNPSVVSGKIGKLAEGGNTFVYAFLLSAITVVNDNTVTCKASVVADPEQSVATIVADAEAGKLVLQLFTQTTKSNVVAANWRLHSPRNPAAIEAPKPDSLVLGSSSYTKLGNALVVGHNSAADMGSVVLGHGSIAGRRSIVIGHAVLASQNSDLICFAFSPTQQIAVTSSSFIQMLKTNCSEVPLDEELDLGFYIDAITGVTDGREEGTFTAGENVCILGRGLTLLDGDYVEASATWTNGSAQGRCTVVESSNTQIIVTLPRDFIAVPEGTEVSFFVHGRAGDAEADQQIVVGTSTRVAYVGDPLIAYFEQAGKARNTFCVDANAIVTIKGAGFTRPNIISAKFGKLEAGGNSFAYAFNPTAITVVDTNTVTCRVSADEDPLQTIEQLTADSAAGLIVLRAFTQMTRSNDLVATYVPEQYEG